MPAPLTTSNAGDAAALAVQPDQKSLPEPKVTEPKESQPAATANQTEFKVADVTEDTIFLALDDGRHIAATLGQDVEKPRRGSKVKIEHDGLDKEGAPKNARITGAA